MSDLATLLPNLLLSIALAATAIILHELAHGYAALALGDETALRSGRLSLNAVAPCRSFRHAAAARAAHAEPARDGRPRCFHVWLGQAGAGGCQRVSGRRGK